MLSPNVLIYFKGEHFLILSRGRHALGTSPSRNFLWSVGLLGFFTWPRIFVYYAQADDIKTKETLAIMARKLFKFVTPFMILTVVFGLWRLSYQFDYYLSAGWMQMKLAGGRTSRCVPPPVRHLHGAY